MFAVQHRQGCANGLRKSGLELRMDFNRTWSDLNEQLRAAQSAAGGLAAALGALEAHQRDNGFIKDDLSDLQRHVLPHPSDPALNFRVQYNPKRALRFAGSGLRTPPQHTENLNNGCFLCRENIRWQQQNQQVGFEINITGDVYHALMNPFPLFPNHVVMAYAQHIPQEWDPARGDAGLSLPDLLGDLCEIAHQLPSHVGFYNGVDAGASIPGHLHFQFIRRLFTEPLFPLEQRVFELPREHGGPEMAVDYPVPVALWRGPAERVVADATAWITDWAERNAARASALSSNFIAMGQPIDGSVSLYFVPRERQKARWLGNHGLVGGLELLGELVLSTDEERVMLESGVIDYTFVERALASVHTPLFID